MARNKKLNPSRILQGIKKQPIGKVQWVERDKLRANLYNPNKVAPPELNLLKLSIMEDGWTQPIVARSPTFVLPNGESGGSVDGWAHLLPILGVLPSRLSVTPQGSSMGKVLFGGTTVADEFALLLARASETEAMTSSSGSKKRGAQDGGDAKTPVTASATTGMLIEWETSSSCLRIVSPSCASNARKLKRPLLFWRVDVPDLRHAEGVGLSVMILCSAPAGVSETQLWPKRSVDPKKPYAYVDETSDYRASLQVASEIVDGFHRWTVAADPQIAQMTDGRVPVVYLDDDVPLEHQMMSTVRHNRARGEHGVLPMADIVRGLVDGAGLTREEVSRRMEMEEEEVDRLYDHAGMVQRVGEKKGAFGTGWVPDKESKQQVT